MGEKDKVEKLLADYDDVFTDIVNVLLFNGKELIRENELEKTGTVSQYKADDSKLHEQERDIAKNWKKEKVSQRFSDCGRLLCSDAKEKRLCATGTSNQTCRRTAKVYGSNDRRQPLCRNSNTGREGRSKNVYSIRQS